MNEDEIDEGSRKDIEWHEREERMDRILREYFPELDKLGLIKWIEDWLFTQNEVDDYDYQRGCYRRALQMFECGSTTARTPADFADFIQPAIEAFFDQKPDPTPERTKLAMITKVLDLGLKPPTKLAMIEAIMDLETGNEH